MMDLIKCSIDFLKLAVEVSKTLIVRLDFVRKGGDKFRVVNLSLIYFSLIRNTNN